MMNRRKFVGAGAAVMVSQAAWGAPALKFAMLPEAFAALEKRAGGRLGVFVLDTATGESAGHRAQERFAMCSTFKSLLAGAVLTKVDHGKESLERAVKIPAKPLISHSPLTEPHAGATMTVRELCFAVVTQSDNTAANVLLETIGGPGGVTSFAKSLGDDVTRLDRWELELNEAKVGDPRDTTSPEMMVADWKKMLLGDALSQGSREMLTEWLVANQTGDARLRKGFPKAWKIGDKTGTGDTTANDVAIVWPAGRAPVLIASYLTELAANGTGADAVHAEVGRLVAEALRQG